MNPKESEQFFTPGHTDEERKTVDTATASTGTPFLAAFAQKIGAVSVTKVVRKRLLLPTGSAGLTRAELPQAQPSPTAERHEGRRSRTHTLVRLPAFGKTAGAPGMPEPLLDGSSQMPRSGSLAMTHSWRSIQWSNPSTPKDEKSLLERLEFMDPLQRLAWLLLSCERDLRPLSAERAEELACMLLAKVPAEAFLLVKPTEYWVVEPLAQIKKSPNGEYERVCAVDKNGRLVHANHLTGRLGTWVTPQGFAATDSARTAANAQRIKAISLAGLLIANDRLPALTRFNPAELNPMAPAAELGFDSCNPASSRSGLAIGTINGFALGLVAQAGHFFRWLAPWRSVLRDHIGLRTNELTGALSLAVRTWTTSHQDILLECAQMFTMMLQLGALPDESVIAAMCPRSMEASGMRTAALGFAYLATSTFQIDPQGLAAERILRSARFHGFQVTPAPGTLHPMTPYAQADMAEAVGMMVHEGLCPEITDRRGKTVLECAREARATRVCTLLEGLEGSSILTVKEQIDQAVISTAGMMHNIPEGTAIEHATEDMRRDLAHQTRRLRQFKRIPIELDHLFQRHGLSTPKNGGSSSIPELGTRPVLGKSAISNESVAKRKEQTARSVSQAQAPTPHVDDLSNVVIKVRPRIKVARHR